MRGKTRQECRAEGCAKPPLAIVCILWFFLYLFIFLACLCWYREASGYCRLVCFLRGHGSCIGANVVPLSRLSTLGCMQEHRHRTATNLPILLSQGGIIPHPFLLPQGTRGDQGTDHREHLGEGAAGSVLCSEGFDLRNVTGTWFTWLSNFMPFQFGTGPDTWNSKFEVCKINFP